jgi:hypothetical protein
MGGDAKLDLLRLWDKSGRAARNRILERLLESCKAMTGEQLEHALDNTASLMLVRISSWLRLTYALGQPMALQLKAIGIFISAVAGRRFLAEFVVVGGIATLVEIVQIQGVSNDDKDEAIQLLIPVSEAGRRYKEVICESGGIAPLAAFMGQTHADKLHLSNAGVLLYSLGTGNPQHASSVRRALLSLLSSELNVTKRVACANLRQLLASLSVEQLPEDMDAEYAVGGIHMLHSFDLQVLHEAEALYSTMSALPPLRSPVLQTLLGTFAELPAQGGNSGAPAHVQASAARALSRLLVAMPSDRYVEHCATLNVVSWFVLLLARRDSVDCQRAGIKALQLIFDSAGRPAAEGRALVGEGLHATIRDSPDAEDVLSLLLGDEIDAILSRLRPFMSSQAKLRAERDAERKKEGIEGGEDTASGRCGDDDLDLLMLPEI